MSTNLSTILVGLGYDLSALEKGAPEAFRLINQQTLGMSAEMKRASREGAESWRLIDEALGIHLSRPLTRIVTQEFPAFANALQSVLGAGVVGALGVAAFEGVERAIRKVEEAEKKQEEWARATEETQRIMAEGSEHYAESIELVRAKLAAAQGDPGPLHQIEQMRELGKNVSDTRKLVDELAAAMQKEAKAAEEAGSLSTRAWLFVAEIPKTLVQGLGQTDPLWGMLSKKFDQSDQTKGMSQMFSSMKENIDEAFRGDAMKGTHDALRLINEDLTIANAQLQHMADSGNKAATTMADQFVRFLTQSKDWAEQLQKLNDEQRKLQQQDDANAAAKKALEQQHEAIQLLQGDLKRWNDEANKGWETWIKINAEIEKTVADLGNQALPAAAARFAEFQKINGPIGQIGPPPGAPQLADQVELAKVTDDQNEAWRKAGEILQEIETPLQKYNTALAVLKELEDTNRISAQQFAQAQTLLNEQLKQSEDRIQKLLEKGGAAGGFQAFMMQLSGQAGKGTGQFTFDLLNKGLQGFEDETAKALTGAKTNWMSFFESLDQMALKFMLNKLFSSLLSGNFFSSLFGSGAGGGPIGGGGAANVGSILADSGITGFASGTDYAPGGMAWVGENGPELVNLPTGASVTPAGATRGGAGGAVFHIDARGGEIGVEDKIVRALSQWTPHVVMRAVVEASEVAKRSVQQR
jgi:hypothetical protein